MSASGEEDFASAEEGDEIKEKKPVRKGAKGEQNRPASSAKGKQAKRSTGDQQVKQKKKEAESFNKETPQVGETAKGSSKKVLEEQKSRVSEPAQATHLLSSGDHSNDNKPAVAPANALKEIISTTHSKEITTSSSRNIVQEPMKGTVPENVSGEGEMDSEISAAAAGDMQQQHQPKPQQTESENPSMQMISRDAGDAMAAENEGVQTDAKSDGGWSWGWGSSFINAATSSLETFTSQVGEGLATIIDTVESSLGVPDPQELAQAEAAVEKASESDGAERVEGKAQQSEKESTDKEKREPVQNEKGAEVQAANSLLEGEVQEKSSWLSGWGMSSLTSMGKSLVNKSQSLMNSGFEKAEVLAAGGLDILETIGKKTYTTLTEHDPGLRRAREFLHLQGEKPSLSFVLKEAQEQAEKQAKLDEEFKEALKINFGALFEDNQGFAHLEALEMLSNQSERKVQSLLSHMADDDLDLVRPHLVEIKDVFQLLGEVQEKETEDESEHDFSKLVTENLSELHMGTTPDKLNQVQESVRQWIADFYSHEDHGKISDVKEVQQRAIQSLAEVTAKAVEQFHKAGELVLLQNDAEKSCVHRAKSLARLAQVLVTEVDILATKFSQCLNKIAEEKNTADEVNPMVTNIYVEASNACGYIQDAFRLLLPVLQHAALQSAVNKRLS